MADHHDVPVITLDGPSSSGKGTISKRLAQQLKWHYLDSGALYRVLAYCAKLHRVKATHEQALSVLAKQLDVQFTSHPEGTMRVILEGEDVTDQIRSEECGNNASKVAAIVSVRRALLARQRAFCEPPGLVTDGRDMGTVVFPHARLKIFLDATLDERAQRRSKQLKEKGINVSIDQIRLDLIERDERDKMRSIAPLKPAKDAIVIDTTGLSVEQVLTQVLSLANAKRLIAC